MHEDCMYCIKRDICTMDVPKPCKYRYNDDEHRVDRGSDVCSVVLNTTYLPNTYKKMKKVIEPAQDLAEINHLRDEVAKLRKENESLKEEQKTMVIPGKMIDKISKLEGLNEQLNERIKELENLKAPTVKYVEEPSSRSDILKAAEKCVCGQREQDYGTPESNFQLIADLWNGYLGFMDHPQWKQIRATDVAMMMALMKIARIRNGGGSGDSFVDLAGYAACGGEIWYGRKEQISKGE